LRWLLHEMVEKENDEDLAETLRVMRERAGTSFVEQVEALVSAKLSTKQNHS